MYPHLILDPGTCCISEWARALKRETFITDPRIDDISWQADDLYFVRSESDHRCANFKLFSPFQCSQANFKRHRMIADQAMLNTMWWIIANMYREKVSFHCDTLDWFCHIFTDNHHLIVPPAPWHYGIWQQKPIFIPQEIFPGQGNFGFSASCLTMQLAPISLLQHVSDCCLPNFAAWGLN